MGITTVAATTKARQTATNPIKVGQLVKMATGHHFRDAYGYGIVTDVDGFYMWVWFGDISGNGCGGFKWCEWSAVEVISETW